MRPHDPAGYLLGLAAFLFLGGLAVMAYQHSLLGTGADPWHHFWWVFGFGMAAAGGMVAIISVVLFARYMLQGDEIEAAAEVSPAVRTETPEGVEEEIVRRFRTVKPDRRAWWKLFGGGRPR